jgi:hypothetical protein
LSLALLDDMAAVSCAGQFNAVLAPYASVRMTCDILKAKRQTRASKAVKEAAVEAAGAQAAAPGEQQ